jgi:SAM-dependent methyltransferase
MYLALPAGDGPMVIHRAGGEAASILELGSGPGRVTRVLVALGHAVVAVDDSEEMLQHVTGAEAVCADLFQLDLARQFDVVVAASHLVNTPGRDARSALLQVCRRHVHDDGVVLVERYPPGWLLAAAPARSTVGPVELGFEPGPLAGSVRSATMTYRLDDHTWSQDFDAEDIDDVKLRSEAGDAGLAVVSTLTDDATWVALRPRRDEVAAAVDAGSP